MDNSIINNASQRGFWTGSFGEKYIDRNYSLKKINELIKQCQRTPFEGIGKPERLKGDLSGWWSCRIDHKHRLVYRKEKKSIFILQCRNHY